MMPSSALAQAFYISPQFSRLQVETKDYRLHPVLGGISSSRWDAYERFAKRNSLLVDRLSDFEEFPLAVKLKRRPQESPLDRLPEFLGIRVKAETNVKLRQRGLISGDRRNNQLIGSRRDDILFGRSGDDILIGGSGDDLLSGGAGADLFLFRDSERLDSIFSDTITDFRPDQGDRILIEGASHFVGSQGFTGRPGEVQAITWMVDLIPGQEGNLQPWMIQGVSLAIDDDGDQRADGFVEIPGLTSVEADWLGIS